MNVLNFLPGFKTYFVALVAIVASIAALLGVEIPAVDASNAFQVIVDAVLAITIRKGIKTVGA